MHGILEPSQQEVDRVWFQKWEWPRGLKWLQVTWEFEKYLRTFKLGRSGRWLVACEASPLLWRTQSFLQIDLVNCLQGDLMLTGVAVVDVIISTTASTAGSARMSILAFKANNPKSVLLGC